MPDDLRIIAERDLTPEGFEIIRPVLIEIGILEETWVRDGDEDAYERWRRLLAVASDIVAAHYVGPNVLPPQRNIPR